MGRFSDRLGDNWELKLTGKNLTDEDNFSSGSRSLGGFINMAPVEYMSRSRTSCKFNPPSIGQ